MPHWNTFTTNAGCDKDLLTRNATIKVIETTILYFTLFGVTKYSRFSRLASQFLKFNVLSCESTTNDCQNNCQKPNT